MASIMVDVPGRPQENARAQRYPDVMSLDGPSEGHVVKARVRWRGEELQASLREYRRRGRRLAFDIVLPGGRGSSCERSEVQK